MIPGAVRLPAYLDHTFDVDMVAMTDEAHAALVERLRSAEAALRVYAALDFAAPDSEHLSHEGECCGGDGGCYADVHNASAADAKDHLDKYPEPIA